MKEKRTSSEDVELDPYINCMSLYHRVPLTQNKIIGIKREARHEN